MSLDRLRVAVIVDDPPRAPWHQRVAAVAHGGAVAQTFRPAEADIIIDLAHRPIAATPRLGIWRYGFGDGAAFAHGARGTLARLYRLAVDPARGAVLREGWFRAPSDDAPGTPDVGDRVADWCRLAIRQAELDPAAFASAPVVSSVGCDRPLPPAQNGGVVASVRDAVSRWRRRERWTVGIVPASLDAVLDRGELPEPRWLTTLSADCYLADPFPLHATGDRITLLAEEYHYRDGRGRIVRVEAGRDGCVHDSQTIFDPGHHQAYPFVWRDGASTYCVPDASAAGQVRAFPIDSPGAAPLTLLPDFPAVDPTLVRHRDRWWMFCTRRGRTNQTDLFVFDADAWQGPWRPHPLNPVKTDARSSRPAGACIHHRGMLLRPAQDCSRRYGGAITLNRIVELTPTRFREEALCRLTPSASWRWPDGLHTINAIDDLLVIDALRVER